MSGWIKLHRSILDSSIFLAKPEYLKVWIFILASVGHSESKFPFNGADIIVPSGSFISGRDSIAKKCDISPQCVRSALNYLKSTSRITIKSTNKYSVISVLNWDEYQQINQQINQPVTNKQPASNHKQECKEVKNVKNNTYSALDSLTTEVLQQIAEQYKVDYAAVFKEKEGMNLYCKANGKKYKDYKAALQNWVRRKIDEKKIPIKGAIMSRTTELLAQKERQYVNN